MQAGGVDAAVVVGCLDVEVALGVEGSGRPRGLAIGALGGGDLHVEERDQRTVGTFGEGVVPGAVEADRGIGGEDRVGRVTGEGTQRVGRGGVADRVGRCCISVSTGIAPGRGWPDGAPLSRSNCPRDERSVRRLSVPPEVILLAVRWYLRYVLSYWDLEELLAERGVEVVGVGQHTLAAACEGRPPLRCEPHPQVFRELEALAIVDEHIGAAHPDGQPRGVVGTVDRAVRTQAPVPSVVVQRGTVDHAEDRARPS